MSRTSKSERRKAKQMKLTLDKAQRELKAMLRMSKIIALPGVPHQGSINDWVRHLRQCEANHHTWVRLQATVSYQQGTQVGDKPDGQD